MEMHALTRFRRLALVGVVLCTVVVILGAWVRLSAAGLGCPDWPTCYGHLTAGGAVENQALANAAFPDRPVEYQKALREMIHRYAAILLGVLALILGAIAIVRHRDPHQPLAMPIALVLVIGLQGTLGMLTVTWLLKPLIVTLHLLGGMTTLVMLWWLSLKPELRQLTTAERSLRGLALFALLVLVVQIALGGWTSTNYAAVACPDFPRCQNSFWPQMDFKDAFVLWRGLGIDYEGGVLEHPARVAIHFVHRLGALVTTITLAALVLLTLMRSRNRRVRRSVLLLASALLVQLSLGAGTVLFGFPLPLATAHNAGAALLLLAMVNVMRVLWPANAGPRLPGAGGEPKFVS